MSVYHTPVLLNEVLAFLKPTKGQKFIDCNLGGGGHSFKIAEKVGDKGLVVGLDLDSKAIEYVEKKNKKEKIKNLVVVKANFSRLRQIVDNLKIKEKFDGVLFDLGLSSAQLADKERGFSFKNLSARLKMSFSEQEKGVSAEEIVNTFSAKQIAEILTKYGQEPYARQIANVIVETRKQKPLKTVGDLLACIEKAVPAAYKRKRLHPATRTWQALRIAVNQELENLSQALPQAVDLLKSGGRLAVISYHSLEDRIVKHFFKQESRQCICPPQTPICVCGHKQSLKIITKKPVRPSLEEIKINPRARSARLRVAEKV